jgi:hypothetical protein
MVSRLVQYLENSVFQNQIASIVVDFIKDDMDQWWLLQVKAFRLKAANPGRPLNISGKFKRLYNIDSEDPSEISTFGTMPKSSSSKNFLASKSENAKKWLTCGCCSAQFVKAELPFTMTVQMVTEVIRHLQGRMHPKKFNKVVPQLASGLLRTVRIGKRGDDESTPKGMSKSKSAGDFPSLSNGPASFKYYTVAICKVCWDIYTAEVNLQSVEAGLCEKFGTYGLSAMPREPASLEIRNSMPVDNQQSQKTLCRLVVAIQFLHDVPIGFRSAQQHKGATFSIRINFLGFKYEQKVDFSGGMVDKEGKTIKYCPVDCLRLFHFFAENTPLTGELPEKSDLLSLIKEQKYLHVELWCEVIFSGYVSAEQPEEAQSMRLGSLPIPLAQFRSSFVKSYDMFRPLCLNESRADLWLKAVVGIERVRYTDTDLSGCSPWRGVQVPPQDFACSEPLPEEWLEIVTTDMFNPDKEPGPEDDDEDLKKEQRMQEHHAAIVVQRAYRDRKESRKAAKDQKPKRRRRLSVFDVIRNSQAKTWLVQVIFLKVGNLIPAGSQAVLHVSFFLILPRICPPPLPLIINIFVILCGLHV